MTHRAFSKTIVAVIFMVGFARVASADPIAVTSGGWSADFGDPPFPIVLRGDGFSLSFFPLNQADFIGPLSCLSSACSVGAPVDLSSRLIAPFVTNVPGVGMGMGNAGPSQVNGVTYPELFFDGFLNWNAPTVGAAAGHVTAPFSFTGALTAFTDAAHSMPPVFSVDLIGRGQAAAILLGTRPGNNVVSAGFSYSFESSAPPVPEPATVLLLGSGAAAVAIRARKRRTRSESGVTRPPPCTS